jgi:glucose-fructose oxidoreductase
MAIDSAECSAMIAAAARSRVKLMIAYRLHFEKANLQAVQIARGGRLGELRLFNSVFSMQVRDENIRISAEAGGGPLYDLGVYCINAARYLFQDEPTEVVAFKAQGHDPRFAEVEEAVSAILTFPGERLAQFTCSFGAADASHYQIIGTKGDLRVDPAYEYEGALKHRLTIKGKTREKSFPRRDQFAAELLYFSDCILSGRDPEPGGADGRNDVRIIQAIFESVRTGRSVKLAGLTGDLMPTPRQEIHRPPVRKRRLIHVESAHQE